MPVTIARVRGWRLLLIGSGLALAADAWAEARLFGWLEWATIEPIDIRIKAKLDTGARTSSLHAVELEPFIRDGREWIRFQVPISARNGDSAHQQVITLERPVVRAVLIKAHRGAAAARPVVDLELCLGGITFTTPVTLADRSRFNYPLLLGRRALEGRAVVDVARKYANDGLCQPRPAGAGQ